jgi:DNA-binding SARP family transcriptional activator
MDLARIYILQAAIAARQHAADDSALIDLLDGAAQIADRLGHDAFLAIETLPINSLLRRAAAAGWARATTWLLHHQEMRLVAQMIAHNDQRLVLTIRAFGTDEILLDGQPVKIGWFKAREVLYYLLSHPSGATSEALREAIWPELSPERSRGTLKTAIWQLRSALPPQLVECEQRVYRLNQAAVRIVYDVAHFLQILDTHTDDREALFQALDLYHGAYLLRSDNQWCSSLRTHLEQRYFYALRLTAQICERDGGHSDALSLYARILDADLLDEAAHAGVMRCHIALGNRAAAINQYQTLRRTLDLELGLDLEHSSEAEQLYHRILHAS